MKRIFLSALMLIPSHALGCFGWPCTDFSECLQCRPCKCNCLQESCCGADNNSANPVCVAENPRTQARMNAIYQARYKPYTQPWYETFISKCFCCDKSQPQLKMLEVNEQLEILKNEEKCYFKRLPKELLPIVIAYARGNK